MAQVEKLFNQSGAAKMVGVYDSTRGGFIPMVTLDGGGITLDEVTLAADGNPVGAGNPLPITGLLQARSAGAIIPLVASFQRPADTNSYAQYDLIGVNTSQNAGNAIAVENAVFANGDGFRIERLRLRKTTNTLLNASFRVHVWSDLPTFPSIGDNGAQGAISALVVDSMQYHVDYFDVTMDRAASGATAGARGIGVPSVGASCIVKPNTGTGFYLTMQALASGGYAPGNAEQFFVTFEGMRA